MPRVRRYDRAPISGAKRSSEGFLTAPAFLTRTGVLEYVNPDGTVRRELRLPQDVFHADSLASYDRKPLTIDHPAARVDSSNARSLMAGVVTGPRKAEDGQHVEASVTVYDADTIAAIDQGRRELSPGYDLSIDPVPGGKWTDVNGEIGKAGQVYEADFFQRDIVANHVAIVPRARAGSTAAIRLDSAGDELVERSEREDSQWSTAFVNDLPDGSFLYISPGGKKDDSGKTAPRDLRHFPVKDGAGKVDLPHLRDALSRIPQANIPTAAKNSAKKEAQSLLDAHRNDSRNTMKITINGQEFEVADDVGAAFAAEASKADAAKVAEIEKRADAAKADASKLAGEKAALEAKVAEQAKRLDAVDAERATAAKSALVDRVAKATGSKAEDLAKMAPAAIHRYAIGKLAPSIRMDGRDDAFAEAAFETAMSFATDGGAAGRAVTAARDEGRQDAAESMESAQNAMFESVKNAWKPAAAQAKA